MNDKWKGEITVDQVDMLKRVAQSAATKLQPVEAYSTCVLLSMAVGRSGQERCSAGSRTAADHASCSR